MNNSENERTVFGNSVTISKTNREAFYGTTTTFY